MALDGSTDLGSAFIDSVRSSVEPGDLHFSNAAQVTLRPASPKVQLERPQVSS